MANKNYYTFMKIKAPDPTKEGLAAFSRKVNEQLEALTMKVYGNIEEADLHSKVQKTIHSKVGNEEFSTAINQTAQQIELRATKQEVADSLDDFAGQLSALTDTVDGKTTTYFLDAEPLSAVINDVWYETDAGKVWKKIAAGTGMDKWSDITTDALKAALLAAADAKAVADGKIETYSQPSMPAGTDYAVGDLWFDTDDANKLYRWNGTAWASAQDTHLDTTVTTHTTQIQQNANAIALKADKTTVDALGNTVSSLSSELDLVPEQITAKVTNKTHHYGENPPPDADMYIGKVWVIPSTKEQVYWRGVLPITQKLRSYQFSKSGASVSFNDLSDVLALGVTVKTVASQAGSGTPSPDNVRAIIGKASIKARRNGNNLFDPGTSSTSNGITKTVNSDGSITLNGTATANAFFWVAVMPIPGGPYVMSANNPVANSGVRMRVSDAAQGQVWDLQLSTVNAVSAATTPPFVVGSLAIRIDSGTVLSNFVIKPQLALGSTATAFEAYTKTDYTMIPSATLYGLSGLEDEIGADGHETHRVKMLSLTGSEGWWLNAAPTLTTLARFTLSLTGMALGTPIGMCSHFPYNSIPFDAPGEYATGHMNGDSISIYILKSRLTGWSDALTAAEKATLFKTWLSGKSVQVLYQLATPTTATVVPVQINGVDGVNNVTSDGASVIVSYVGSGWGLVSGSARRLYAGANYKMDENGLEITQTSLDGKPVATKFIANSQKYGIFRSSDGKLLQGAKTLPDGSVAGVSSVIVDPNGDDNASYRMRTDDSGVWLDLVHGTHTGPGPTSNPDLENPPITAWDRLISIGANVVPNWVPGAYSDEIFVTIKALLGAAFAFYGSSILFSALNSGGSSTCGMSLDDDGAGRIKFWGAGFVPTSNGGISVGSPSLGINYYYGTHTSIQSTSDERAKHDMRTLDPDTMLRFIVALDPSWYRLNDAPEDLMAGFRAQQFMEAMRRAGIPDDYAGYNGKDPDHLCLDYGQVIAPLVSVVQAQQRRIEAIEARLSALEALLTKE